MNGVVVIIVVGAALFAIWFLARKGRAEKNNKEKNDKQVQREAVQAANKSLRELNKSLGFPEGTGPTGVMLDGEIRIVNVGHAERMKSDPAYAFGDKTAAILLEMNDLENALKEAIARGDDALVNKINKALASLESEANAMIEQHQREHNVDQDDLLSTLPSQPPVDRATLAAPYLKLLDTPLVTTQRLADEGHANAQYALGDLYREGHDVTQDYAAAANWYRLAANQGFHKAQFFLGFLYENGRGVPKNCTEATKWYRLAADQGNANAECCLAYCYYSGHGVPQDHTEAAKWYDLAANQGIPQAQHCLGLLYRIGRGVPQDNVRAHMWFNLAAATSYQPAMTARDEIAKNMPLPQITEAQKLAREWKPSRQ